MAFRAGEVHMNDSPPRGDDMLARYMRGLLRNGGLALREEDVRTCTHCGARARFHLVDENGWSACSKCGSLA